jgi:hypothetical protein
MKFSEKYNFTESDSEFDKVYPSRYQNISKIHWTPVEVIKTAINWLEGNKTIKILDIGSGVGKFCVLGSILSKFTFVGVEKRKNLFLQSKKTATFFKTKNVFFINDNITNINFQEFDAFYYFNPFCEQIAYSNWIDQKPDFSEEKYSKYEDYVIGELSTMPIGTKVITYCSDDLMLSSSYRLRNRMFNGQLLLWIKEQ